MSVAKQVQASSLNVELVAGALNNQRGTRVPFFEGAPANADIVESSISTDAVSHVAEVLNLTPYQVQILEANAISVTAHRFRKVQGSDVLIAVPSMRTASMVLHSLGFTRRTERGALRLPSFMKVLETQNGSVAVATARLENETASRCVYVDVSVDVNTLPM